MVRVRHYTRVSSLGRILAEGRIVASDQNKVFVERATRQALAPRDAERTYGLARGKGNAYVEFDIREDELESQYNERMQLTELFVRGDVVLVGREAQGYENR